MEKKIFYTLGTILILFFILRTGIAGLTHLGDGICNDTPQMAACAGPEPIFTLLRLCFLLLGVLCILYARKI